jgi:hypothetical protein
MQSIEELLFTTYIATHMGDIAPCCALAISLRTDAADSHRIGLTRTFVQCERIEVMLLTVLSIPAGEPWGKGPRED